MGSLLKKREGAIRLMLMLLVGDVYGSPQFERSE